MEGLEYGDRQCANEWSWRASETSLMYLVGGMPPVVSHGVCMILEAGHTGPLYCIGCLCSHDWPCDYSHSW